MRNNHSSAAMSYRNVVACNASSVMPRQSVISTAPRVCIIAVAMPSPIAVVVVATPQSPVVVTPVPPPAVGECREAIQVESVVVDIPEPRIGKCQDIKIQLRSVRNCVSRISVSYYLACILVVVCRAVESVNPAAVGLKVRLRHVLVTQRIVERLIAAYISSSTSVFVELPDSVTHSRLFDRLWSLHRRLNRLL